MLTVTTDDEYLKNKRWGKLVLYPQHSWRVTCWKEKEHNLKTSEMISDVNNCEIEVFFPGKVPRRCRHNFRDLIGIYDIWQHSPDKTCLTPREDRAKCHKHWLNTDTRQRKLFRIHGKWNWKLRIIVLKYRLIYVLCAQNECFDGLC